MCLQSMHEAVLERRVEDDARRVGACRRGMVELLGRAHDGVQMLDGRNIGVLSRGGPGYCNQSFTGGVGKQVKVEITCFRHLYDRRTACGYQWKRPRLDVTGKPLAF